MRVAVVTEFYRPTLGGVQEHVWHFAREARRLGHVVTVVTSRVDGYVDDPADDVVRLGHSLPLEVNGSVGRVSVGAGLGRTLRRLLGPAQFDVVHLHAPLSPVLPVLANRATSLPLVATYHTNFPRNRMLQAARGLAQSLANRIDIHVAVSEACVRAVKPYVRADFRLVPNGVDAAAWARGRPLPQLREGRPVVAFLGRLEPRCGLDRLLDAWGALRIAGHDPTLLVVGDGPERARLEQRAHALGLSHRFVGARWHDRADLLASADLLACPTTIASFGVTLLEGMAAGLPIVASDIDGFREVLTAGREGLLVPTDEPGALARALATLLGSPMLRARMGAAGRATAVRYDWAAVTKRVLALYDEAIERRRAR